MFTKKTPPVQARKGRPSRFSADDVAAFVELTANGEWVAIEETFDSRNKANTFGVALRRELSVSHPSHKVRTRVIEESETEYTLYATTLVEEPAPKPTGKK